MTTKPTKSALIAAACAVLLAGCTSTRIGGLNTTQNNDPEALPPAPTGTVSQSQLPPPAAPAPAQTPQFPETPQPPVTDTTTAQPAATETGTQVAAASGGGEIKPGSVAGVWNASVGGQSCRIATPQTSFGPGYRAAPLGCPAPVAGLKAWAAKGSQLVLFDENGAQIATLYSSGGSKFDGQTADGKPISLTR
jgi:hypothetical protein